MIQAQIQRINGALRHQISMTPEAQLLTTIPGLSVFGALLILTEIGDSQESDSFVAVFR